MLGLKKSKTKILRELNEKQPLPMGVTEFHAWSDRIIAAAMVPGATADSQKFALANELTHCGAGTAFESDGYFVARLRKHCVNQVAFSVAKEIRDKEKARLAEEEAKKAGEVLPEVKPSDETKVLAN